MSNKSERSNEIKRDHINCLFYVNPWKEERKNQLRSFFGYCCMYIKKRWTCILNAIGMSAQTKPNQRGSCVHPFMLIYNLQTSAFCKVNEPVLPLVYSFIYPFYPLRTIRTSLPNFISRILAATTYSLWNSYY